MMRDNLFEVVTTSRTFYIQVGGLPALRQIFNHYQLISCLPTKNNKFMLTKQISLREFPWENNKVSIYFHLYLSIHPSVSLSISIYLYLFICPSITLSISIHLSICVCLYCYRYLSNRQTVPRRCTAGSKPSRGPSWPSAGPAGRLQRYVSPPPRSATRYHFPAPFDRTRVKTWSGAAKLAREPTHLLFDAHTLAGQGDFSPATVPVPGCSSARCRTCGVCSSELDILTPRSL